LFGLRARFSNTVTFLQLSVISQGPLRIEEGADIFLIKQFDIRASGVNSSLNLAGSSNVSQNM
jgi:hypothetical protein